MEFIVTDKNKMATGYLKPFVNLDFDIDEDFDFELRTTQILSIDDYIFCPDTEYGGQIKRIDRATNTDLITYYGDTWRGYLEKSIIEPLAGQDYRKVSGDGNAILRTILGENNDATKIFNVPTATSTSFNFSFNRYCSKRLGLMRMFAEKGYNLRIWTEEGNAGEPFVVWCECYDMAEKMGDDYILGFSQDNDITLNISKNRGGYNHLICLGKGELKDRQVVHLYADPLGVIGEGKPYYTGEEMRTAIYDYSSAESREELVKGGIERFLELKNSDSVNLDVTGDIAIGEPIYAFDDVTGVYVNGTVNGKILRVQGGEVSIEIIVKGGGEENEDY